MKEDRKPWNSQDYDQKFAFVSEYGEDLLSILKAKPSERILDLGCGTGDLSSQIANQCQEFVGMDSSSDMIATARSKYPRLHFIQGDAAAFNFDKPFDAIFSNAVLHWVLDYRGCIDSMYANLKPGGRLVLEFGGKHNVQRILEALRRSLSKRSLHQQAALQMWYFPSIGEYSIELEAAGFKVLSALQFDRPTELTGDIKDWLEMFAGPFFSDIPKTTVEEIKEEVFQALRKECFRSGKWIADYKRLRILAIKEDREGI